MYKTADSLGSAYSVASASPSSSRHPASKTQRTTADYSLSCAECRRLKLKCSRQQWPCDTCIKRGIAHLCPDGVQKKDKSKPQSVPKISQSGVGSSNIVSGGEYGSDENVVPKQDSLLIWSRLDNLEKKLDLLIESSLGASRASKTDLDLNGSLHDLASIATDHYLMESAHGGLSRSSDDASRQQHGTLTLHPDGRAHYMGSNAHSMYLARENLQEGSEGRRVSFKEAFASRPGSPTPVDMEAAAGRAMEAVPSSPQLDGNTPSTVESQPSQLVWATPGFRSPHSSTAIWNYLKSTLPQRDTAQRMMDVYYSTVTFMFHPIPRIDFEKTIWNIFYSQILSSTSAAPPNFHPHKLSLLYSMLSLGVLLDVKRPQRDAVGRALYSCAWNALALSNFTEATSLEAILALMHINMYLTWRRGGRYAESAYPLLGTMMRMTISTGLHRDPALFNLGEEEREKRRRVFWDVQCSEVFRAFAFSRPPALCDRHVDTKFPSEWRLEVTGEAGIISTMPISSTHREGVFHAFKCRQVQITNRMLDECLCANSNYQTTMRFDKKLRQLLSQTPAWMLPTLVDFQSVAEKPNEDLERSYNDIPFRDEMILEMQRHTTLLNHYQALLLLHRGWFSQALQLEEEGQVEKSKESQREVRLAASIEAVNESSSNVIAITISAWCKYPALVIRWAFFWNAIFSAAVCRGLYVVKSPFRDWASEKAWDELKRAIELLGKAVIGWSPLESPLGILKRLNKRAEVVMQGRVQEGRESGGESEGEDMELIGDERREIKKRKSKDVKDESASLPKKVKRGQQPNQVELQQEDDVGARMGVGVGLNLTLLDTTDSSQPTFDLSNQTEGDAATAAFMGLEPSSLHSTMLPSVFANQITPSSTLDIGNLPNSSSSTATNTASASQLIQMLSSGLSWDDVSSFLDPTFSAFLPLHSFAPFEVQPLHFSNCSMLLLPLLLLLFHTVFPLVQSNVPPI